MVWFLWFKRGKVASMDVVFLGHKKMRGWVNEEEKWRMEEEVKATIEEENKSVDVSCLMKSLW